MTYEEWEAEVHERVKMALDHEIHERARKTRNAFVAFALFRDFRDPSDCPIGHRTHPPTPSPNHRITESLIRRFAGSFGGAL